MRLHAQHFEHFLADRGFEFGGSPDTGGAEREDHGVGFFTDSYDIFTASMLTIMLGIVYYPGVGTMPTSSDNAIKLATSAGTVVGQLGFGLMADIVGRKRMYGLELIVIIFATLGQALTGSGPAANIIGLIIFWRVIMGIGIGGDYPLSSIITSE